MNDIERIYELYKGAYTVTTDSRTITPRCVFVALKGEHFDGNDFAISRGNNCIFLMSYLPFSRDAEKRHRPNHNNHSYNNEPSQYGPMRVFQKGVQQHYRHDDYQSHNRKHRRDNTISFFMYIHKLLIYNNIK